MVKCDLDSILSYQTAKVVRIKDKRLGLLHYGFICLILGYIVGYQVLYNKMYLDLETPIGSVRTSLLRGQNMTRERISNFPYCLSATNPSVNDFPNLPCIFWKEGDALYPPTEQTAMFITTRVNITDWALNCSLLEPNCTFSKVMNTSYYVGGIDRFTIMLDHTMYASKLGIQANAKSLPGRLLDQNEDEVRNLQKPNSFGQEGKNDILEVRTLLKVAGVSLDDYSTSSAKETNRYAGVLLLVFIVYDNTHSFNTNDIRYTVKIREVKNTEFKSVEEMYFSETTKRERNRHGVRLIFLQTGQLGKFQFQVLLLTMVSGLALLAVSTLIVDLLALMVLPQRKYYEKYKYYDVDFEKMSSQDELSQPRVNVVSNLEEPLIANKE